MGQDDAADPRGPVCVIAVIYEEPWWKRQTVPCLEALDVPVFYVDRRGTGNLAAAYNRGFARNPGYEFVWFVSNVTFKPELLGRLTKLMRDSRYAAIHPSFVSDHRYLRPNGSGKLEPTHFVEFTAPIVRSDVFERFPLDERMPYWGHDMDWCWRVREAGYLVGVDHGSEVGHVYNRHLNPHPVTRRRASLRRNTSRSTSKRLEELYGHAWKDLLGYRANYLTMEEKATWSRKR